MRHNPRVLVNEFLLQSDVTGVAKQPSLEYKAFESNRDRQATIWVKHFSNALLRLSSPYNLRSIVPRFHGEDLKKQKGKNDPGWKQKEAVAARK